MLVPLADKGWAWALLQKLAGATPGAAGVGFTRTLSVARGLSQLSNVWLT